MAKQSAIQKNERRKRLVAKYANKRQALLAMSKDQSLNNEERLMARLAIAEVPDFRAPTR